MLEILGGFLVLTVMILMSGIKVVKDHDRLVVFRFGKAHGTREPGVRLIVPFIDRCVSVDTRIVTVTMPAVEEVTLDGFHVSVSAVCTYRISDAMKSVTAVHDLKDAILNAAESAIRRVFSRHKLEEIRLERRNMNALVKTELQKSTKKWGLNIASCDIKDLLPASDERSLSQKPS